MNHNEIEASVIGAKNGNQEELLKLLEQFKPFIFKTAKEYNIRDYDIYDLVQIGYITLISAIEKYKTESHTFSTYAYNAIKNNLRYTARQNSKYLEEVSLNLTVRQDEQNSAEYIECIDSLENIEEDIIKAERDREIRRAVSRLPAEEMELVIMLYFSGCSLKTYAGKKGLSYNQACRRKRKALERLTRYLRKIIR